MKTIWKFELEVRDSQEILIPSGAKMLSIQAQNEIPCLWCLVNPQMTKIPYVIRTVGTGNEISNGIGNCTFIGTYQLRGGSFIGHVFLSN